MASEATETPYNPLDKVHLAESVGRALLERPVGPLPPSRQFAGAGIYAIYYLGSFEPYAPITQANRSGRFELPIYVGKAIPTGGRKGAANSVDAPPPGPELVRRLTEHARSIEEGENLVGDHFLCRHLVVDDVWIALAERLLVHRFQPLWNVVVDGFGNHDPGQGRHGQRRSPWDVLHPGRPWAARLRESKTDLETVLATVSAHLRGPSYFSPLLF